MLDFDAHFSLTSVACAIGPSFYHILNWFFVPKPGFLNLFEFSAAEIT
jgi:hypothetical protein